MSMLAEKAALRRRLRARRRRLADEFPEAARRAAALFPMDLLTTAAGSRPPVVAAYRAMAPEIDPAPLLARVKAIGAVVVLPAVRERGAVLCFQDAGDPAELVPDAAGILAPPLDAPRRRPDLIIAPLLAFDRYGGRLGQGGGYYDRTLRALREAGPVRVVGIAYAGQEIAAVPMGPLDERLDAILTENGYSAF